MTLSKQLALNYVSFYVTNLLLLPKFLSICYNAAHFNKMWAHFLNHNLIHLWKCECTTLSAIFLVASWTLTWYTVSTVCAESHLMAYEDGFCLIKSSTKSCLYIYDIFLFLWRVFWLGKLPSPMKSITFLYEGCLEVSHIFPSLDPGMNSKVFSRFLLIYFCLLTNISMALLI